MLIRPNEWYFERTTKVSGAWGYSSAGRDVYEVTRMNNFTYLLLFFAHMRGVRGPHFTPESILTSVIGISRQGVKQEEIDLDAYMLTNYCLAFYAQCRQAGYIYKLNTEVSPSEQRKIVSAPFENECVVDAPYMQSEHGVYLTAAAYYWYTNFGQNVIGNLYNLYTDKFINLPDAAQYKRHYKALFETDKHVAWPLAKFLLSTLTCSLSEMIEGVTGMSNIRFKQHAPFKGVVLHHMSVKLPLPVPPESATAGRHREHKEIYAHYGTLLQAGFNPMVSQPRSVPVEDVYAQMEDVRVIWYSYADIEFPQTTDGTLFVEVSGRVGDAQEVSSFASFTGQQQAVSLNGAPYQFLLVEESSWDSYAVWNYEETDSGELVKFAESEVIRVANPTPTLATPPTWIMYQPEQYKLFVLTNCMICEAQLLLHMPAWENEHLETAQALQNSFEQLELFMEWQNLKAVVDDVNMQLVSKVFDNIAI